MVVALLMLGVSSFWSAVSAEETPDSLRRGANELNRQKDALQRPSAEVGNGTAQPLPAGF